MMQFYSKQLIQFSFNQLINLNIHLGTKDNYWNPLIFNLTLGVRQNHYFLNLNLTILNLRYSFNLIKLLLKNNYKILFFNNNFILNKLLLNNYAFVRKFQIYFGVGKWVNGFLNNFKLFKLRTMHGVYFLLKSLKKKLFKKFFKLNNNKIWNFCLFLRHLKYLPSGVFLMFPDHFAIFETMKLNIFSMALMDVNKLESVFLATQYLIPFNYLNFYSLLFLFTNIKYLLLLDQIRKKKFFFFLIFNFLKKKIFKIKEKKLFQLNIIFMFLGNLIGLRNKQKIRKIKLFSLLNYKRMV